MKYKFFAISVMLITGPVFANQNDDYVSLGYTYIKDGSYSGSGVGFSAARIDEGKEFGVASSFDYSEIDVSGYTVQYYDAFIGPVFRPKSNNWLRVYPLIGFAYAYHDGASASSFAYGAGAQFSIPDSPYYLELNYKKPKGYDTNIVQISAGYNF